MMVEYGCTMLMGVLVLQREEAREGARRAVEAAGRAGDQPQAAAAGQLMPGSPRHPPPNTMRPFLFHLYSYFLFDYTFVNDVINFLYLW